MSLRNFTIRLSSLINRNTGYLIMVVIVIFGVAILGFQRDNRILLMDTRSTVENTQKLLEGQQKQIKQQEEAVRELLDDNKRQTELIICLLAIHGESTAITQVDQELCQERIDAAKEVESPGPIAAPPLEQQPSSNPSAFQPELHNSPPEPEPEPSVLERAVDRVTGIAKSLWELLTKGIPR